MAHIVSTFIQRSDHARRQLFDGDIDQAIVSLMVSIAALDHRRRVPEFRNTHGDLRPVVGIEGQRGVNAQSIAEETGIPRETVRRKLRELEARGAVVKKDGSRYIMKPGFVQRPENPAVVEQGPEAIRAGDERRCQPRRHPHGRGRGARRSAALMNACVDLDFVRWVDANAEDQSPKE